MNNLSLSMKYYNIYKNYENNSVQMLIGGFVPYWAKYLLIQALSRGLPLNQQWTLSSLVVLSVVNMEKKIHPNVKLSPFREIDWEMLNYLPLDK